MDEKLILLKGQSIEFEHDFVDHNLNDLSWWTRKHDGYALREAADLLMANDATSKKRLYRCLPLFWRAAAYFFYRYILRLGFLDGREGPPRPGLQGWWYRTPADANDLALQPPRGGGVNHRMPTCAIICAQRASSYRTSINRPSGSPTERRAA